jgi:hypothetical protein
MTRNEVLKELVRHQQALWPRRRPVLARRQS